MPTFKVKTDTGDGFDGATDKIDFPHGKAASRDAQTALFEMAREKLPLNGEAHFGIEVEDNAGHRVYKAQLDFEGRSDKGDDGMHGA